MLFKQSKGIKYEAALEKYTKDLDSAHKKYLKENEQQTNKPVSEEEYRKVSEEFFLLEKKLSELAFRYNDNLKQKAKGQPSLDVEDTGVQWKNDPIE